MLKTRRKVHFEGAFLFNPHPVTVILSSNFLPLYLPDDITEMCIFCIMLVKLHKVPLILSASGIKAPVIARYGVGKIVVKFVMWHCFYSPLILFIWLIIALNLISG
jgi:hypothetical protein